MTDGQSSHSDHPFEGCQVIVDLEYDIPYTRIMQTGLTSAFHSMPFALSAAVSESFFTIKVYSFHSTQVVVSGSQENTESPQVTT